MTLKYIHSLLDVFIKWWWAALTGVASVLSWLAVPSEGIAVGRWTLAIAVFAGLTLVLLTLSVLVQGYRWYAGATESPRVLQLVPRSAAPEDGSPVCMFVVRESGWKLSPGHLFSLYRTLHGEEVCVAVIRVERARQTDDLIQCSALWIPPAHLRELRADSHLLSQLSVRREIPERVLEQMKKERP